MGNPYVISAELDLRSANLENIIEVNRIESFRTELDADLRAMGKDTRWVDSVSLRNGIAKLLNNATSPIVSLDNRYITNAERFIGVSRGVNLGLRDAGYVPRAGYDTIASQLATLPSLGNEILLADDVLFTGEMISWLAGQLQAYDVKIGAVVCGIAIQEGIEKLELEGIAVEAVEVFEEVEDEICERDFAFVPGSGRRLANYDANALYFDNTFGRPQQWASIPAGSAEGFCVKSIERSMCLLKEDVPAIAVGPFLGYGNEASAKQELLSRLGDIK